MKRNIKILAAVFAVLLLAAGIYTTVLASGSESGMQTEESADSRNQDVPNNSKMAKTDDIKLKPKTHADVIDTAASVLGKTKDEIKESIKNGKVGDLLIAAEKVDDFKVAYLADTKSKLDEAVAAGTLTQEQADEKYTKEKVKMDAYDGTTHLCGGKDHSKMFERKTTANVA